MQNPAKFNDAAQFPIEKCTAQNAAVTKDVPGVFMDPVITDASKEPCAPRDGIEPPEVATNRLMVGRVKPTNDLVSIGYLVCHRMIAPPARRVWAGILGRR